MWLKLILCFLVTCAWADHNSAWKHKYEYVYHVRGHILASLNQISNDYSGIYLKAKLIIRPTDDGHLKAKITNPQYANIHSKLPDHWKLQVPESELSYQAIPLSSAPFKIWMENGVIKDVIIDKTVSNWEANIIKGVVSQLQLDTEGENHIRSSINTFRQEGSNSAVFKTLEKTITGETETLYEIHPLPAYVLQTTPWLAPLKILRQNEEYIEVVKTKNFTHHKQSPSYHFGFHELEHFDIDNQIGEFLSRTSVSRAVLSGNLDSFTIQSSVSEEEVTVSPSLQDKQRGSSKTLVNLTLYSMEKQEEQFGDVANPINVGLVYWYDRPFDDSNEPQPRSIGLSRPDSIRRPFSVRRQKRSDYSDLTSSETSGYSYFQDDIMVQEKPHIHEPPASPLLPLTSGYGGQAFSKKTNIKESVRNLAIQIGKEFQYPEKIPEENTVGKFLILSSFAKVMNFEEMKHVSNQLYPKGKDDSKTFAWIAYRDAVAQAGTGPALLTIEEWIRKKEITGSEAAEVVATAASSARQPTEKYMKVFFQMIQNPQYMEEKYLNESLILSYTTLVHQVYVDGNVESKKYPVHSFGSFNTPDGHVLVTNDVIPYLSSKLQEAILKTDTHRIYVYIRALGNVGHRHILQTFKPYLEGKKGVSQLQRLSMIVALDKLRDTNPKVVRSVLFRIYQNLRDDQYVRVAAVYQLLKSHPSPSMLQRMAHYTTLDMNKHVNSAVKSMIESASKLEEPRFAKLREAAESAKHLLTSEEFGVQNSQMFLTDYVVKQMHLEAKQTLTTIVGEDSALPKGINYVLRGRLGGFKQQVVDIHSMVSSIEDLIVVFDEQTKFYRQLVREKQSYQSVKTKWSSEHTAKLLNVQNEQREQLEGYLYLHLDDLQKVWTFDNHTVENITKVVKELEDELREGKHFKYSKMGVYPETVVSFPNEWGVPFIYTYDKPMLMHLKGEVKAVAKPTLYSDEGIQKPETVDVDYKISGFISGRVQSKFGFVVPFNHKRYSAGYDKNFQLTLPDISGKIFVNVENGETKIEVSKLKKDVNLLHFSTWPYTTQHDIDATKPETKIIRKAHPQKIHTLLGEKYTGLALQLDVTSDKILDYGFFYDYVKNKDFASALLGSWLDENIDHVQIDIGIDGKKTSLDHIVAYLSYQNTYFSGSLSKSIKLETMSQVDPVFLESRRRQQMFLENSTDGITNGEAQIFDAVVLFKGQKVRKYSATFSAATDAIYKKSRVLLEVVKDNKESSPVKVSFTVDGNTPIPPSLDLNSAMEFDPTTTLEVKGTIEEQTKSPSYINAKIKLSQSEDRKEYLTQQTQYKICQKEMKEGNNQLPACAAMTAQANLMNKLSVEVDYKNLDDYYKNQTYKLYSMLRQHLYFRLFENILVTKPQPQHRLGVKVQHSADLSAFNVSISSDFVKAEISDVQTNEFFQSLLIPHPVYNMKQRLEAYAYNYDAYEPMCVVDSNAVNTLDNKTYPASFDKEWVILLHYVPRRPSPSKMQSNLAVTEQLNLHVESYIAYGRVNDQTKPEKEIKIVIQSPYTMGRVIDVTLKPSDSSSGYPRLYIQNELIVYGDQGSHIYDGYMQVYKLPNNEIQLEVFDTFYVAYDGIRAKFVVINDKFRDATRGLCGTFTGEPETDFTHPRDCIIHSPEVFIAANTVFEKPRTKRMNDMLMIQAEEKKCYRKTIRYVPVVSAQDSGIAYWSKSSSMKEKTKYVVLKDETCFSIQPLPACKSGFREYSASRVVPVHCVKSSGITDMLKSQIDQGASPSFRNKALSKEILMEVAERCEP